MSLGALKVSIVRGADSRLDSEIDQYLADCPLSFAQQTPSWRDVITEIDHDELVQKALEANEKVGIMGFAWSAEFRAEVKKLSLDSFRDVNAARTFLLVREELELTRQLQEVLGQNMGKFGYEHIEHPGEWGEFDAIGSLLLPQATIKAVIACLV